MDVIKIKIEDASVLPCPFCGHTDIDMVDGSTIRWVRAECQYCGAMTGEVRIDTLIPRNEAIKRVIPEVIKEWNTRYVPKE